jgi:hypothetical protein
MASPQANGYYPRLNAAMVGSGKFNGNIVSLMGRFVSGATDGNHVSFQCSDGGTLSLSVEHADFPNMDVMDGPVVEVVGQVMKENEVAVRIVIYNILYETQLSHVLLHRCDSFDDCGSYCIHSSIATYFLLLCNLQLFVTRELSKDTDLQVYDKMIAMQHNPKFAKYFAPIDGNVCGSGMVTN